MNYSLRTNISTLITGSTLEERLKAIEPYQHDSPLPPINLDGRDESISIKSVREWTQNISFSPAKNTLQRHFILEAQHLTLPAQHALLKTLEEPPVRTQIIITCDHKHSLLETILSRCQHFHLDLKIEIDPDSKNLLSQIVTCNYADLIKLASDLAKKDPETKVTSLLNFLRSHLVEKPTLNRAKALAALEQTLKDLKTNANKQLVLEHLFFTLKSLTK